ncbi:hypothetical protein PPYR_13887 [Photinus pyralis]|uniref:Reverse transcriptase domain-containing protein n=1 Tax=Photinus pyralis TaxID=7054 RepID=A0A5N4AAC6_PHOPY|nr:hypothetical protein PPYR_13887 [Photinus pyralis]
MFADDLNIYISEDPSNIESALTKIQEDLNTINSWSTQHGLKLNYSKCKYIIFGHDRVLCNLDYTALQPLVLQEVLLNRVDTIKLLGLTLQNNLSWTKQVNLICNQVNKIYCLKSVFAYLPCSVKKTIIQTAVFPNFNYGIAAMANINYVQNNKLQRAENLCVKYIFNLRIDDRIYDKYKILHMLKIRDLQEFRILNVLFSILKNKTPEYLNDQFTFFQSSTRQQNKVLVLPTHKTEVYAQSFTVKAIKLYNNLPEIVKTTTTAAVFKKRLKDYLLNKNDY